MPKEYDNEMKFVLFVNDRKRDEKDADRTGTITINGVEYYLNGWNRKNGVIGGTVKPKRAPKDNSGGW